VTNNDPLLKLKDVSKSFHGLHAVKNYNLTLRTGEILGIIGPNGAGKSTVFNLLSGHIRPTSGTIFFKDRDITHASPDQIARIGIGRTFQNIRLFQSMTVIDNVKCSEQLHEPEGLFSVMMSLSAFLKTEHKLSITSLEALSLFKLEDRAYLPATSLPYGDQRRLEIVRALALQPQILLLDEPTAGMNPKETTEVLDLILRIHDDYHLTIIIVEHNMSLIMKLCTRIQVLNYGVTIAEGDPEKIRNDPRVIESYLGKTG